MPQRMEGDVDQELMDEQQRLRDDVQRLRDEQQRLREDGDALHLVHQQGDRCRSRKAVDDPYREGAQPLVEREPAEPRIQPGQRRLVFAVTMLKLAANATHAIPQT